MGRLAQQFAAATYPIGGPVDHLVRGNLRMAEQFAAKGDVDIRSDPNSVLAGAIGAAAWGAYRAKKLAGTVT